MMNNYTPFNPPAHFWRKSWTSLSQLIINGLLKSMVIISSFYWVKNLSSQIRQAQEVDLNNVALLLIAALLLVGLRLHERYVSEKMSQKYINTVRSGLLKRLMRASVRDIQSMTIGNLSSRLAGDLSAVKRWLSLGIARLVTHSILLIGTLLLITNINASLGLLISLAMLTLISIAILIGNYLKHSIKQVRKNRIKIHSLLVERLSAISTIRAMGKEQKEIARINLHANKLERNISKQGLFLGLMRGIGDASSLILISLFFIFNSYSQNILSTDEITALISIILFVSSPIRELGRIQEYYQGAKLSITKLQELYNIPRIIRGRSKKITVSPQSLGEILINNIYLNSVFKGQSFHAKKGQHIALTGKNGMGKSSLISLILGLINPDSGTIKINGIAPSKTKPSDRSRHMGCYTPSLSLLKGSLKKNLCYRKYGATDSEINALMSFCQLDDLLQRLEHGINTQVIEQGDNFSSGEIARISLFRALLGTPEILILDEPESYLDKKGFLIIKQLINNYQGTLIIATHNTELISICDKQWNLDQKKNHSKTNSKTIRLINNHAK